jgi:hypothetical protein
LRRECGSVRPCGLDYGWVGPCGGAVVRGLRCVMVLVGVVCVKGAFGVAGAIFDP